MKKFTCILAALIMAANLFAQESSLLVSRDGNTYYYDGQSMNEYAYAKFLKNNCPEAYKLYRSGNNTAIAGWVLFTVGVGLDLGTAIGYLSTRKMSTTLTALSCVGLGCEIACIPTLIVGYKKKHKSTDIYNASCAKKSAPQAYWSVNASQNGIGLAYNF